MLTDIFARRYENRKLFDKVQHHELRLLVQAYRIINEQMFPYYGPDKKVDAKAKAVWMSLHDRLTMELGIKELSPKYYSYQTQRMGQPYTQSGFYDMNLVCEAYLTKAFNEQFDEDLFMKNRLSFVELAFREREAQITQANTKLPAILQAAAFDDATVRARGMTIPGIDPHANVERAQKENELLNSTFAAQVHELNTRFTQASMPLNYHNGYIQIATDALTQTQIEQPFWDLVKDAKWGNISTDMAEAIDRRDTGGRDPAFYAAKALESTIKIICVDKNWVTSDEKGAADYLNHLEKKANGPFIDPWERQLMTKFFSGVRNALGHGPGGEPMPSLTIQQTDQAIELCMSWIKSLIRRL